MTRILSFMIGMICVCGGFVAEAFAQIADATDARTSCPDVPGAAALFKSPEIHVVWVGELHGTNEMPALFGDLVCTAGLKGRPVIVGLERNDDEQPLWDAWLKSDGSGDARKALLEGSDWSNPNFSLMGKDGRSSEAVLGLAERLRTYKARGLILDVRVIRLGMPAVPADGNLNEAVNEGMARHILDIVRENPDALILAYSAGVHARRNIRPGLNFHPAASFLPASQLLSVRLVGGEGEAWTCRGNDCGISTVQGVIRPRGIVFAETVAMDKNLLSEGGFDALGYTGIGSTASLPAIPSRKP